MSSSKQVEDLTLFLFGLILGLITIIINIVIRVVELIIKNKKQKTQIK